MYRNILVPVAFDQVDRARRALQVARSLADSDARITVMHVMESIPGYVESYVSREVLERNRKEIAERLSMLAGEAGGNAGTQISEGHPGRVIIDFARDNGMDCIVMASHRPGLEDFFLGSTAAWVVRHAICSVHVMR